jgi:siroheme decarboxylase
MLSQHQKVLLNNYQQAFPMVSRPYLQIANEIGISEGEVIQYFQQFKQNDVISRVGPVIAPNVIGSSALVAMSVPEDSLESVAAMVSRYPEINHNYERDHLFNLWFVAVAESQDALTTLLADIEQKTGMDVMVLPMIRDFYINLGFELDLDD